MSINSSNQSSVSGSCFTSRPATFIFTSFTVTNLLLLLPLSVLVLCLGFQRCRQQRSGPKAAMMSHSDIFTYNMVAIELIGMMGSISCCCGTYMAHTHMLKGCTVFAITSCVKMYFHVLTCAERYVAVVHPITYRNLRQGGGVRARNISICCVWFGYAAMMLTSFLLSGTDFTMILFFCLLCFSLVIITFFSLSVLQVLAHPGPGDGGGDIEKADKSRQRAFHTISAIMGVLLMRFGGNIVCQALASSPLLSSSDRCVARISGIWFCLPSSYVLPLLFLHRRGKLQCCKKKPESG